MKNHRCQWMADGRFGLMVHYLPGGVWPESGARINDVSQLAQQFNLKAFLADFDATGADWLIFTVGQNTGAYLSPNRLLDEWAGPGFCSERNLIAEIATEIKARGKRFICYAPCEVRGNPTFHQAFRWTQEDDTDQAEFQKRYTDFLAEWAMRWGTLLDGWWMDGCYTWPHFHNGKMNWPLWYGALRAGNPQAAVTFNDGSFCCGIEKPIVPEHDYTSGETEQLRDGRIVFGREADAPLYLPESRFVGLDETQWHALVPVDSFWAHGAFTPEVAKAFPSLKSLYKICSPENPGPMEPPLYSDECLKRFVDQCRAVGGAVTLNAGIYQEGHLGPATVAQLRRL